MGTWILTDCERDTWVETLDLSAEALELPRQSGARIVKRRLRGGLRDGLDLLSVDNGAFSLNFIPTRGMGIWDGAFRGKRIGWRSPVHGPVHPAYVHATERGGLGWLNGFDECLCRCGLASNGPPCRDRCTLADGREADCDLTLHGRIANLPASRVSVTVDPGTGVITVEGIVEECGMFDSRLRLTTRISTVVGANTWSIADEISNIGGQPVESQLLYHCNFGRPALGPDARLCLPVRQVAPRDPGTAADPDPWDQYGPPTTGRAESCFFIDPLPDAQGWVPALLRAADGRFGIEIGFDAKRLPCFSLWKCCAAEADGYVTGLEPGTNYPNPRGYERKQGRVRLLPPGGAYRATLSLTVWDQAKEVEAAEHRIAAQQGDTQPIIQAHPVEGFSPTGQES